MGPFINPSKAVTELLSKYLEFDPKQLQLGIWSGDLSIRDVNLKREALYPLLNDLSERKDMGDPRVPLNLKLVDGSVGHMRLKIPWKRLAWGQGDVQVQISDVTIALGYESREDTAARKFDEDSADAKEAQDNDESDSEDVFAGLTEDYFSKWKSKADREAKQAWLREAESCQLRGLPIPSQPPSKSVEKEKDTDEDGDDAAAAGPSALDRRLNAMMASFTWRFFAGLQATIRNVRIVIVQDGVEMGVISHSLEILAGKQEGKDTVQQQVDSQEAVSTNGSAALTPATPPPDVVPKGEYDDGEHVDKTIKIQGWGVFVRRETNDSKAPETLRFSSSVTADDYILRPTEGDVSFSFFYPYPQGKQKKQKAIEQPHSTPTTATVSSSSVASSKARRGKREKHGDHSVDTVSDLASAESTEIPQKLSRSDMILSSRTARSSTNILVPETLAKDEEISSVKGVSGVHRRVPSSLSGDRQVHFPDGQKRRASLSAPDAQKRGPATPLLTSDEVSSVAPPPRPDPEATAEPKPHIDLKISFGDVKTLCSSRHYELALVFNASVARMKNGRPNKTIASCLKEQGPIKTRSVYVDAPSSVMNKTSDDEIVPQLPTSSPMRQRASTADNFDLNTMKSDSIVPTPTSAFKTPLPLKLNRATTTGSVGFQSPASKSPRMQLHLQLQLPSGQRSDVVKSWWNYAYSAVLFEVRQQRTEQSKFVAKGLNFDWERQSYRRKEYVDLYIATRLESNSVLRSVERKVFVGTRLSEAKLLRIEDELPVEQILLYRAIARALLIRGKRKMPDSVLELQDRWLVSPAAPRVTVMGKIPQKGTHKKHERQISDTLSARGGFHIESEAGGTDVLGIRREANAVRNFVAQAKEDYSTIGSEQSSVTERDAGSGMTSLDGTARMRGADEKVAGTDGQDRNTGAGSVSSKIAQFEADARTVRSFKTARTKLTSLESKAADNGDKSTRESSIRLSFSFSFSNIDFLVYRERKVPLDSVNSINSMHFHRPDSSDRLDAAFLWKSAFQLTGDGEAFDDLSDLSFLSDDEFDDVSSAAEEEDDADEPIMSSSDFLLFGLPSDVLLHVVISRLTAQVNGKVGKSTAASLTVDQVRISGKDQCHLLSIGTRGGASDSDSCCVPVDEVQIDKRRKRDKKDSCVSFAEMDLFSEHAVSISVARTQGTQVQCNLSRVFVTGDLKTITKLVEFLTDIHVSTPRILLETTPAQELRRYILRRLAIEKKTWSELSHLNSTAFRVHGIEVSLPCRKMYALSPIQRPSSNGPRAFDSSNAQVKISSKLLEYYDGSLVDDIRVVWSETMDGRSRTSQEDPFYTNAVNLRRRHLNMLNVSELLCNDGPNASRRHAVVAVTGVNCGIHMAKDCKPGITRNFLDSPIDVELLLTQNDIRDFQNITAPKKQLVAEVSPVQIVVSEARLEILSRFVSNLAETNLFEKDGSSTTSQAPLYPRLSALSGQIIMALDLHLSSSQVAIVDDSMTLEPTTTMREIVMEESLSDFLSVMSCFHLDYPAKEALDFAGKICVDRLMVLGLSDEEAQDCVNAARLNFLADLETMKDGSEVAESSQEPMELENDDDPSLNGVSDEGSEQSMEIIHITLKTAIEKTMLSFSSLMENDYSDNAAFEEQLLLCLPLGGSLTMTRMFYDFRLEARFQSLCLRDTAGSHLLRIDPVEKETEDGNTEIGATATDSASENGACDNDAVTFSFFALDQDYDFAAGGMPLTVLGSSEEMAQLKAREREQLNNLVFGQIELLFSQKLVNEAIQSLSAVIDAFMSNLESDEDGSNLHTDQSDETRIIFRGSACSACVMLASDELAPFCRVDLKNFTIDNVARSIDSHMSVNRPSVNCTAASCLLLDLTPEGYGYPEVLFPLVQELGTDEDRPAAMRVRFFPSTDKWKEGSEIFVDLNGMRLIVLRRFVNELLQYIKSEDYGLGLLLSKFEKPVYDVKGDPPPPLRYHITFSDSSVILPRSSTCMDMVAIEVEKITVYKSFVASTFTMPSSSSDLIVEPDIPNKKTPDNVENSVRSSSSPSEMEFFDAVDPTDVSDVGDSFLLSNFSRKWIPRLTITLEKMRLFSSLPSAGSKTRSVDDAIFHKFGRIERSASSDRPVYTRTAQTNDLPMDSYDKLARYWREMSSSDSSLEVIIDYVPNLRMLITDHVVRRCPTSEKLPLKLDVLLSEWCLLLSIWYSNMQELPLLFPYSLSDICTASRAVVAALPEYGTPMFVQRLKSPSAMSSEIALIMDVSIRGSFDEAGYFSEDPPSLQYLSTAKRKNAQSLAIRISVDECVAHVTTDNEGILRLSCGASRVAFVDESRDEEFEHVIVMGENRSTEVPSGDGNENEKERHLAGSEKKAWADLSWGLDCSGDTFSSVLPQAYQLSVFMTPGWCLINLGMEQADAILEDLSPIWILLDFFTSYFKSGAYGNPTFEAQERLEALKDDLVHEREDSGERQESLNMDFRLWLLHPCILVPSSTVDSTQPSLSIECSTGFWYRYKSLGTFSMQEMGSTDLSLRFAKQFTPAKLCRDTSTVKESEVLIERLSCGMRMDFDSRGHHTDYVVRTPFFDPCYHDVGAMCNVTSPPLSVDPVALSPPAVCVPFVQPSRSLGSCVSEITLLLEILPVTSSLLLNLVTGPTMPEDDASERSSADAAEAVSDDPGTEQNLSDREPSFALAARIGSLRVFAIDPVLKKHLPVAVASVSSLNVTASQLNGDTKDDGSISRGEAYPRDLQVVVETLLWADYFKLGTTRSWEPLVEPFDCLVMYEKSRRRGHGLSLNADDAFHVNITGALLLTIDDIIDSFARSISETFGVATSTRGSPLSKSSRRSSQQNAGVDVEDHLFSVEGTALSVRHQIPKIGRKNERVAFSFRNVTGQKIRIHQLVGGTNPESSKSIVTYLENHQSTTLTFDATISVLYNFNPVEVPFPGLPHSHGTERGSSSVKHEVDVQLPGFRWLGGISVNTSGRKFDSIVPRSPIVLSKIESDWRLENAMKVLTEVGLENGGRLIAVRSLFEIRNRTSHPIILNLHPDPTHQANSDADQVEHIEAGDAYYIPSLLLEASLHLEGNHLGCLWISPNQSSENSDFSQFLRTVEETGDDSPSIGFCSRPVQLAKLVHESALIFQSNQGEDVEPHNARSGVQVSCPAKQLNNDTPLAPFCYVIEVRRSPLVKSIEKPGAEVVENKPKQDGTPALTKAVTDMKRGDFKEAREDFKEEMKALGNLDPRRRDQALHGPVSYTLLVHPPLIIENLLPKSGRFELMHATRRTVLWFADLKPGERVPVHTVGLDAPLLLLVNLGFCRTPVGGGALVHHGSDTAQSKGASAKPHAGLKTIGKAVSKGTRQFRQLTDSPDKRGEGRVFRVQNPQFRHSTHKSKARRKAVQTEGGSLGLDTGVNTGDAKVHAIANESFSPSDVDPETVVIDSVGQRLTLRIENIRGGGGQRRISLYCPFWIVNTTEHALLYKQEVGSSFVSGSVVSPQKDGSKPVDDSDRNYALSQSFAKVRPFRDEELASRRGDIQYAAVFAGKPGALAACRGQNSVSADTVLSLIDKNLPLEHLANVAFMFNFYEDIRSIGNTKICVQLSDGTGQSQYSSSWSSGFSLDSVGVNQVVSMHCKDGRALEVSVTLSVAPSFLSGYTKIVRFTPRYVLVSHLERPIRLWQDSSFLHPMYDDRSAPGSHGKNSNWHFRDERDQSEAVNQYENLFGRAAAIDPGGTTAHRRALYIATASKMDVVPFHLPNTRGERQLRIDLGGTWNLTASFSADATGEYSFKVTRAIDLRLLNHVTTRAAPQYKVILPPEDASDIDPWDGELGIWFETAWGGDRSIIVKGIKRGSYSFNYTDIHVGDELLRIDEFNVSRMTFAETMKILKERIAIVSVDRKVDKAKVRFSARSRRQLKSLGDVSDRSSIAQRVVLTFRTLEERYRRVRRKALRARHVNTSVRSGTSIASRPSIAEGGQAGSPGESSSGENFQESSTALRVDMRMLHHSVFVVVRPPDIENPPYRIENRAVEHVVFFRQRGCSRYPWNQVQPGETVSYTWEEPLRPRKLVIRVGKSSAMWSKKPEVGDDDHLDTEVTRSKERETNATESEKDSARGERLRQLLSAHYVKTEEQGGLGASTSVKLEAIGFRGVLPCPKEKDDKGAIFVDEKYLDCQVDTDGATRVLFISDKTVGEEETAAMREHIALLEREALVEEDRKASLQALNNVCFGSVGFNVRPSNVSTTLHGVEEEKSELVDTSESITMPVTESEEFDLPDGPEFKRVKSQRRGALGTPLIEEEAQKLSDVPEDVCISRCNQVLVEVMEAAGLTSAEGSGISNPYCDVLLKTRSKTRKTWRSRHNEERRTYYIENTVSPHWADQVFIFDVPSEAAHVTRGHSVQVRVRNFHWVGRHPYIGQTTIHLGSLRNQQELVGWYPLVGKLGRVGSEDSLANNNRGSVKLRVQWIYSVPALLEYFLLLSERRLTELQNSIDGMKEQLIHAAEIEKTKKERTDIFAASPGHFGIRWKSDSSYGLGLNRDEHGDRHGRRRRFLGASHLRGTVRDSREKPLLQLYSQTEEKRSRKKARDGKARLLQANTPAADRGGLRAVPESPPTGIVDGMIDDGCEALAGPLIEDDSDRAPEFDRQETSTRRHRLLHRRPRGRLRAFSVPDASAQSRKPVTVIFRDDTGLLRRDILESSRLAMSHRQDNILIEQNTSPHASAAGLVVGEAKEIEERVGAIDTLFQMRLLSHKGEAQLYRYLLPYHFREHIAGETAGFNRSLDLGFRPKSYLRMAMVIRKFKSWNAARAVVNDDDLQSEVVNGILHVGPKAGPDQVEAGSLLPDFSARGVFGSLTVDAQGATDLNRSDRSRSPHIVSFPSRLPTYAPPTMVARDKLKEESLAESRRQFERACKRSLRAVLNPGGWLTIRPLSALYLPDAFPGMFVKLRSGSDVGFTRTVDGKVSPHWTPDQSVSVTPYAHTIPQSSQHLENDSFESCRNDLKVYVEPHQTSGSLRLTVVGVGVNKNKKVELGVLHIPIGSAISCCVECIEEVLEAREESGHGLPSDGVPTYVRWFPLSSPKDTIPMDGDMGLSSRPRESEKERDSMFSQYFTPCIKLALIWEPDDREANNRDRPSTPQQLRSGAVESISEFSRDSSESSLTKTYFNADFGRVSAALIDSQRAIELVSFSTSDIDVRYALTTSETRAALAIGWIQVDVQDDQIKEPVVLAPTPVEHAQPTLQFVAIKDNLRTKSNIESYEYIGVALQEMDLTLEESWMFDLWEFFVSIMRKRGARNNTTFRSAPAVDKDRGIEYNRFIPRESFADDPSGASTLNTALTEEQLTSVDTGKKVFVEELLLGAMKINISYFKGKRSTEWEATGRRGSARYDIDMAVLAVLPEGGAGTNAGQNAPVFEQWSERTHDEDLWTESEDKYSNVPKVIATVFPSVSDAPIRLQAKAVEYIFETPIEILNSIKNYYINEVLRQIYKIIGSVDFVGNPSMVVSSVATGVRDFFMAPSAEFRRSPTKPSRLGIGVAKGTLSLFSHSASGFFGFISKMSASAGQIVSIASFDREFQQWHRDNVLADAKSLNRQWKKQGVQSIPKMVTQPFYDILRGVTWGITGVLVSPYKGARRNGVSGFVGGVAAGCAGAVTKPVVGVFDAFAHASGSVYAVAKSVNLLEKRYQPARKSRLPHAFGPKHVLMPYDRVAAQSVALLKKYPLRASRSGRHRKNGQSLEEIYVAAEVLPMEPGVKTLAVVSSHRVVLFKVKRDNSGLLATERCWEVYITKGSSISSRLQDQGHNGVALIISTTTLPRRKPRIGKLLLPQQRTQFSAETAGKARENSAIDPAPQPSIVDSPSQASSMSPKGVIDDELQILQELGTPMSTWEDGDAMPLTIADNSNEEFVYEQELRGSVKGRDGEVLEWFTVVAEFQQRRQLTRIHNAVCCIIGAFEHIIDDRSPWRRANTEGYTSFGELSFSRDGPRGAIPDSLAYDKTVCDALNDLPWIQTSMFKKMQNIPPERREQYLINKRNTWVLSREVAASSNGGGPMWLVSARAKGMFVPHDPPSLPAGFDADDRVISEILSQLERGNISYNQACKLIASHANSEMIVSGLGSSSAVSSVTAEKNPSFDQYDSSFSDDDSLDLNIFKSLPAGHMDTTASEFLKLGRLSRTDSPEAPSTDVFLASRASLAYLDAYESPPEALVERSHEGSESEKSPCIRELSRPPSLALDDSSEGGPPSVAPEEEPPKSSDARNLLASSDTELPENLPTTETTQQDTRLDRMEFMMQQLLVATTRQVIQQGAQYQVPGMQDDPAVMALRQEIDDLRGQVQSVVTRNDREQMIASLREEVRALQQQLTNKDVELEEEQDKLDKETKPVTEETEPIANEATEVECENRPEEEIDLRENGESLGPAARRLERDLNFYSATSTGSELFRDPIVEEENEDDEDEVDGYSI